MKLWLLRPLGAKVRPDGACDVPEGWSPSDRKHLRSLLIQAETEAAARATAQRLAVDGWAREAWIPPFEPGGPSEVATWIDPARTTCVELVPGRNAHVVMADWSGN